MIYSKYKHLFIYLYNHLWVIFRPKFFCFISISCVNSYLEMLREVLYVTWKVAGHPSKISVPDSPRKLSSHVITKKSLSINRSCSWELTISEQLLSCDNKLVISALSQVQYIAFFYVIKASIKSTHNFRNIYELQKYIKRISNYNFQGVVP